jgi:hypothetical protein
VPRRTRCGICGDALWTYPTPTGKLKHIGEIEGKVTYDHDAAWPAPSQAEQERQEQLRRMEYAHVHDGSQPDCPWCEHVLEDAELRVLRLRVQPKDLLGDEGI